MPTQDAIQRRMKGNVLHIRIEFPEGASPKGTVEEQPEGPPKDAVPYEHAPDLPEPPFNRTKKSSPMTPAVRRRLENLRKK